MLARTSGGVGVGFVEAGDDGDEAFPKGFERFGERARLADHGHEICVAGPARDDVGVKVRNAAAGGGAEIEADVETVGFEGGGEEFFGENDFGHEAGAFGGREFFDFGDLAERDGEEVAGIVGKAVEHEIGVRGAVHNECGAVVAERGQFGERALHSRRISWRLDVFHAPVGVKLLHVRRAEENGSGGQSQSRRGGVWEGRAFGASKFTVDFRGCIIR